MQCGKLVLQFPYDPSYVNTVRLITGSTWDPIGKAWLIPNSRAALDMLKKLFGNLEFGPNLRSQSGTEASSLLEAAERKYLPKARELKITDFKFATDPFWHQSVSFNFARALDQSGLFLEQGLGKAKILIDLATWRYREGQVKRVLIGCPNSVIAQWGIEIEKHGHDDFKNYVLLEGGCRQKLDQCVELINDRFSGFVVVNYDAFLNMYEQLMEIQRSDTKLFDMMGLDESSMIKHATSKRSKICWKLGQTVKYRNVLTGTPITQSLEDIFSQFRFLRPEVFGIYSTAFRGQYLVMGGFEMRQVVGYRNIDDALRKIYSISIRFTKDRCLDLPPKVYETRTVRMDDVTSKKYRQLEKECVAEFDGKAIAAPLVMTKLMKLSQITGGFVYEQGDDGRRVATHRMKNPVKLSVLEEILDESPGRKIIIWCKFTEELKIIRDMLTARGVKHVSIAGDVASRGKKVEKGKSCGCGECRGCYVRQFQEDPSTFVFVGQVATAGMGITLTAANLVIYYSNDYSLEHRLQSEDRCHRIGQKQSVTYVDILAETHSGGKTIDHDTLEVLKGKGRFAGEISRALMQKMTVRQQPAGSGDGRLVKNPARVKTNNKRPEPNLQGEETIMSEGEEF